MFQDAWSQQKKILQQAATEQGIPLCGTFELTPFCNLSCKMCYMRLCPCDAAKIGATLDTDAWLRLAEQVRDAGTLFLLLTGGEPFLRPDFAVLYEALSKMGFLIKLYTNTTLLTPALKALFTKIPPAAVGVSLYGASPETYRAVTGDADAFSRTVDGLDFWKSLSIPVQIRTTLTTLNVHDFDAMLALSQEKQMPFSYCSVLSPAVRGASSEVRTLRLTPKALLSLQAHINRDLSEEARRMAAEELDIASEKSAAGLTCSAGKSAYVITWEGKMRPCLLFDEPYTLPLSDGFSTSWEALREKCAAIGSPEKCRACRYRGYCRACPAMLWAETGDPLCVSSYFCEYAEGQYRFLHQDES